MKRYTMISVLVASMGMGLLLGGCASPGAAGALSPSPLAASSPVAAESATPPGPAATAAVAPCQLQPIAVPTLPAVIPGYTELDPSTGLHMTGTYQQIDLASYRLKVTGKVVRPLSLTYDELRCLPRAQTNAPLICPGFFEDDTTWAGTPLVQVLDLAGIQPDATRVVMVAGDGYQTGLPLETARAADNLLVYEWQGQPLPILHGFPVRTAFPNTAGSYWVKWLLELSVQ